MIYPTARAVTLAAAGAPVALLLGLLTSGLWVTAVVWLIFVAGLLILDAAASASRHEMDLDLEVPASSEIVIEGHVMLDHVDSEGPMAEFPGYLFREHYGCPVFKVTAITHRNDAILPVVSCGMPPEENHTCWGIAIAATVLAELRDSSS